MGKFLPSKYQKDIFNFIKKDTRNAVISAVAGSGKTTTLIHALELIPLDKKVLFLAFNKSISNELKDRVPKTDNITVMTVHGFGFRTLSMKNKEVEIDNFKYNKILRNVIEYLSKHTISSIEQYGFDEQHLEYTVRMSQAVQNEEIDIKKFTSDVLTICNLGRLHFVDTVVKNVGIEELDKLCEIHSIDNEDGESEVAWYLIKLGILVKNLIDFTDMIFLPNIFDLPTLQYDYVFIDECQDLNICQRLLMVRAIKPGGRFIAVGDPRQAIYAFAGADAESYQKLCDLPNTIQLPLSETYRCHEQIVSMVKHINPDIKSYKTNKNGIIEHDYSHLDVKDGDMVLCRQTFPVVSLCVRYLKMGRKAYIIGSDIGISLINMITSCERKSEDFTMINVFSRLYDEMEKLIEKVMNNHGLIRSEAEEDTHVIMFQEKIAVIEALSEGVEDPKEVIEKIEKIFSDSQKAGVCLSNVHKSKGLEAERVFILQPELMPSKYAILPWQILQEQNLRYVAYTRAKTTLGFITDYDAFKQHKSQSGNITKPVESKHVGGPGMKMNLELKVIGKKSFKGQFGDSIVYELVDQNGNIFSKFGEISRSYLSQGDEKEVDVNSHVSFYGIIKEHTEFRGTKITKLGKISQY